MWGLASQEEYVRKHLAILVILIGIPATLGAQEQQGSWSNLTRLKAGQGIEVIEFNMKHHSGKFIATGR